MTLANTLPILLGLAWLLPLVSFVLIVFFGKHMGRHGWGPVFGQRGDYFRLCAVADCPGHLAVELSAGRCASWGRAGSGNRFHRSRSIAVSPD